MTDARSAARRLRRSIQFTAAAAVLLAAAPAARAQGLFSVFGGGPSSYDIERRLDAAGYSRTGPLIRRGDVYLADVVLPGRGDAERLVIDAATGRILQRFRGRQARWRDVGPRDWNAGEDDAWGAPPRPPRDLDRPAPGDRFARGEDWGPAQRPAGDFDRPGPRDQFARSEDPALGTGAPRTTSSDLIEQPEKPKPKPHEVKRKSPTPSSLAKTPSPSPSPQASDPSAAPAPGSAPATVPTVAAPVPSPSPAARTAKSEETPSPPPAPSSPNAATAAKTDAPSAPTAAAKPPAPPEAPDAKPAAKSKAVNDLPVTPLD